MSSIKTTLPDELLSALKLFGYIFDPATFDPNGEPLLLASIDKTPPKDMNYAAYIRAGNDEDEYIEKYIVAVFHHGSWHFRQSAGAVNVYQVKQLLQQFEEPISEP